MTAQQYDAECNTGHQSLYIKMARLYVRTTNVVIRYFCNINCLKYETKNIRILNEQSCVKNYVE